MEKQKRISKTTAKISFKEYSNNKTDQTTSREAYSTEMFKYRVRDQAAGKISLGSTLSARTNQRMAKDSIIVPTITVDIAPKALTAASRLKQL